MTMQNSLSKDGCPFPLKLMGTILQRTGRSISIDDIARLTWHALRMCGSEHSAIEAINAGSIRITGAEWNVEA